MKYKVGYEDEDGDFLWCNTFDTYEEAEYHREMWQDSEDQMHSSGMYIYENVGHTSYIIVGVCI